MRAYELMIIADGELDEAGYQGAINKTVKLIEDAGAVGNPVEKWGKRRFAYEINHKWDGWYAVFNFVGGTEKLPDLERALRIADDIVRHKVIRLPDDEAARRGLMGESPEAA